jgi:hypothetical protein
MTGTHRLLTLGGTGLAAMTLFATLSAPMAAASTPTAATVTLAASSGPMLTDWRSDRCWRWWGGERHWVCDRHDRRGDRHDRHDNRRGDRHDNRHR